MAAAIERRDVGRRAAERGIQTARGWMSPGSGLPALDLAADNRYM